jgi:hypothetical protein
MKANEIRDMYVDSASNPESQAVRLLREIAAQLADSNEKRNLRDLEVLTPRYRPDGYQLYACPYCNLSLRLVDQGACVDSYLNVCHFARLDKA